MKFRRNPLPRQLGEGLCFLAIGLLLPVIFVYEILYLLPALHEKGSFVYILNLVMGIFLVLNIEGNLVACMIIDTSVDPDRAKEATNGNGFFRDWKYCNHCDQLAPPRSWHCKLCGVCILRRDHHCMFSGYCIGHQNHRYFMCFLFHLMAASVYSTVYYSIYFWRITGFKFIFLSLISSLLNSCLTIFYVLNLILMAIAYAALWNYVPLMMAGEVSGEHEKNLKNKYNYGINHNLRTVLGQRMHLAWLFPTIESKLPEDGYTWNEPTNTQLKRVNL